jgi:mRNA-degrading endonuclease YafQ of YafQ-DinJ toxin-antitoxin module
MNIRTDPSFDKDYARLPQHLQERVDQKLALFIENPRHPSLRIKKMQGHNDIWEGHISYGYCFTFRIVEDTCLLRRVGTHEIYRSP